MESLTSKNRQLLGIEGITDNAMMIFSANSIPEIHSIYVFAATAFCCGFRVFIFL